MSGVNWEAEIDILESALMGADELARETWPAIEQLRDRKLTPDLQEALEFYWSRYNGAVGRAERLRAKIALYSKNLGLSQ